MSAGRSPLAKPEPSRAIRRRRRRDEAAVVAAVRKHDVSRDGYCRFAGTDLGGCWGPSEWAHWGEWKRFKTRGRAAEERHTPEGTLMLCKNHHDAYDRGVGGQLTIEALTDRGCEGRLRATRNGVAYEEPADGA